MKYSNVALRFYVSLITAITTPALAAPIAKAQPAPAKIFHIKADIFENGKLISAPSVVTLDRTEASLKQSAPGAKEVLSLAVTPRAVSSDPTDNRVEIHLAFKDQHGHDIVAGIKDFNTHTGATQTFTFDNKEFTHPLKLALTITDFKK